MYFLTTTFDLQSHNEGLFEEQEETSCRITFDTARDMLVFFKYMSDLTDLHGNDTHFIPVISNASHSIESLESEIDGS